MCASIAKAIRISRAKFHCNRLSTVQYIQDYASLTFLGHIVYSHTAWIYHSVCCYNELIFLKTDDSSLTRSTKFIYEELHVHNFFAILFSF